MLDSVNFQPWTRAISSPRNTTPGLQHARQAALEEWVQAGVDDPESLDATTIYAHARKARLA
jgi:hypothetical protein